MKQIKHIEEDLQDEKFKLLLLRDGEKLVWKAIERIGELNNTIEAKDARIKELEEENKERYEEGYEQACKDYKVN